MRREIGRRAAETLIARPWALVGLVAIAVVIPILVLGELSGADMQERLRAERLALGAQAASRSAEAIQTQLSSSLQVLQGIGLCLGRCSRPALNAAVQRGDAAAVREELTSATYTFGFTDVGAVEVADKTGAVLATVVPSSQLQGPPTLPPVESVADREYFRLAVEGASTIFGVTGDRLLLDHPVVMSVPVSRPNSPETVGALIAEIRGDALARHLESQLGLFQDIYIIDGGGQLVGRAAVREAKTVDLSGDPIVRDIMRGAGANGELRDPVSGSMALITWSRVVVNGRPSWTVVVLQPAGGVESQTQDVLAQQRGLRVVLVAILLGGSFAFGRIAAGSLHRRRQLAEAIGQVQAKSRELEAANHHKSEFLANMSHELRTPLNAVIGFSDVLEERLFGDLNERQTEYVRDIAVSGRHLLDLVNEILDLSKVEAGRMELEISEFSLAESIGGAVSFVRQRAERHGIELVNEVGDDIGTVQGDARKIRQVLLNLLSNAVKFTPDGGQVQITARRLDRQVEVSVRDSGIGIAPEDQRKVFDEFQQVGRPSERSREGTGLGLTLAKRFVELHGGRIWLASEVGKGTTFTFSIPASRPAAAPA